MPKTDQVTIIRGELETLKELTKAIQTAIDKLKPIMEQDRYIPTTLGEEARNYLDQLLALQDVISQQFAMLERGKLPATIALTQKALDDYENDKRDSELFLSVYAFFMSLVGTSDDENAALAKEKARLQKVNVSHLTKETCAAMAPYVQFMQASQEMDPRKKLEAQLSLVQYFDPILISGATFGTIRAQENYMSKYIQEGAKTNAPENGAEFEAKVKKKPQATGPHKDVPAKNAQGQDNAPETSVTQSKALQKPQTTSEPQPTPVKAKAPENTQNTALVPVSHAENAETVPTEEKAENLSNSETDKFTEILDGIPKDDIDEIIEKILELGKSLKPEDYEKILVPVGNMKISVWENKRRSDKYTLNSLRNDICRINRHICIAVFRYIRVFSGLVVRQEACSIILNPAPQLNQLENSCDQLVQAGWLVKLTVDNLYSVYVLSKKGKRAFETKQACNFLEITQAHESQLPEDTKSALFAFNTIMLNNNHHFIGKYLVKYNLAVERIFPILHTMSLLSVEKLIPQKRILILSVVALDVKNVEICLAALAGHLNDLADPACLIVAGTTLEQGKKLAELVRTGLSKYISTNNILYTTGLGEQIYQLTDNSLFDLEKEIEIARKFKKMGTSPSKIISVQLPGSKNKPKASNLKRKKQSAEDIQEIADEPETPQTQNLPAPLERTPQEEPLAETTVKELPECKPEAAPPKGLRNQILTTCADMICGDKVYCATALLCVASRNNSEMTPSYMQLAYAVNDPAANCVYDSDRILETFSALNEDNSYYFASAALRNAFYDQSRYDYNLKAVTEKLKSCGEFSGNKTLSGILYRLSTFKTENHCGIDRFADYRHKDRIHLEQQIQNTVAAAKVIYDNYVAGKQSEAKSELRPLIETKRILFSESSDLGKCVREVSEDNRAAAAEIRDYLTKSFIRAEQNIDEANIDIFKIEDAIDHAWTAAFDNLFSKQAGKLQSGLRSNVRNTFRKMLAVLCEYVSLTGEDGSIENESGFEAYKKLKPSLTSDINLLISERNAELKRIQATKKTAEDSRREAGIRVFINTLNELAFRLSGSYAGSMRPGAQCFYMPFLTSGYVLLSEDLLPDLRDVEMVPELSAENRIIAHSNTSSMNYAERMDAIIAGEDDYGSAKVILEYMKAAKRDTSKYESFDFENGLELPLQDLENKKSALLNSLDFACCKGQLTRNDRDAFIQVVDTWYENAKATKNYGFFKKILKAIENQIHVGAKATGDKLSADFCQYEAAMEKAGVPAEAAAEFHTQIAVQNYTGAENTLFRIKKHLVAGYGAETTESHVNNSCMDDFLLQYQTYYHKTSNGSLPLMDLISPAGSGKQARGVIQLLSNWPNNNSIGPSKIMNLFMTLGFAPKQVSVVRTDIQNAHMFAVSVAGPAGHTRNDFTYGCSAFGWRTMNDTPVRVLYLQGAYTAKELLEIVNGLDSDICTATVILLDCSLSLASRRQFARLMKTEGKTDKPVIIIDRIVIGYLAEHFDADKINQMLMYLTMPYSWFQPYKYDTIPSEMFFGRQEALSAVLDPDGSCFVVGNHGVGKTALLQMAEMELAYRNDRSLAILLDIRNMNCKQVLGVIGKRLNEVFGTKCARKFENWDAVCQTIAELVRGDAGIPYMLLMLDNGEALYNDSETWSDEGLRSLIDLQNQCGGKFKLVISSQNAPNCYYPAAKQALGYLLHSEKIVLLFPLSRQEARDFLEVPMAYLGMRFADDAETTSLVSMLFSMTNYYPGLMRFVFEKIVDAMRDGYAGYLESKTPPYIVKSEHIKRVLTAPGFMEELREKFLDILNNGEDRLCITVILLMAYLALESPAHKKWTAQSLIEKAETLSLTAITSRSVAEIRSAMRKLAEMNMLTPSTKRMDTFDFSRPLVRKMLGNENTVIDRLSTIGKETYLG